MTAQATAALREIDASLFAMMGIEEPCDMDVDELAQGVVDYFAEQAAPDLRPDHLGTLIRAILADGVDVAIEEFNDMPDIRSDFERDALLARAEFIVAGMRVLAAAFTEDAAAFTDMGNF